MLSLTAGRPILDAIALSYRADIPFLMRGGHGVGKSELAVQAACQLGIRVVSLDLSVMEPPDLIGLPVIHKNQQTSYAAPSFLPTDGDGLLVLEELNRCSRHMRAPCLQLLTTRRLNDYSLPRGWLPCACINDGDAYHIDELDPALLSRFMQIQIKPDVSSWTTWARVYALHPRIVDFVECNPSIFNDQFSNPRAWAYAARLLSEWERSSGSTELLVTVLAGVIGEHWSGAFLQAYLGGDRALPAAEVLDQYPLHRAVVLRWRRAGRLDLIAATWEQLQREVTMIPGRIETTSGSVTFANLRQFVEDLPADLRRHARQWLQERGIQPMLAA